MLDKIFKSVLDMDRAPIVICDTEHKIIYMNPSAVKKYEKSGGISLIGKSLLNCHNEKSNEIIKKVLCWFKEDSSHNMIYTYPNEKENKDVYMVALRDENSSLIGYYEKHEFRNHETAQKYDFEHSLV